MNRLTFKTEVTNSVDELIVEAMRSYCGPPYDVLLPTTVKALTTCKELTLPNGKFNVASFKK